VALIFVSEGAEAELEVNPIWTYDDLQANTQLVKISGDGSIVAVTNGSSSDNDWNGFDVFTGDGQFLWRYEYDDDDDDTYIQTLDVSDDGEHLVAVSHRYLIVFNKNSSTPEWT